MSQWCHPTISYTVTPFSSCSQSFPASRSFPVSWLFTADGQRIGDSTSTSVFPVNIQGCFISGLTGLILLLLKGLSRVFSGTTIWKHIFFSPQPSLWSYSLYGPNLTWLLGKDLAIWIFVSKVIPLLFNTLSRFVIAFHPRSCCC